MARRLTEPERLAIVSALGAGLTDSEAARRCGTTRQAVGRLRKTLKAVPTSAIPEFDPVVAKSRVVRKSYAGIEAALDDPSDSYKRAGIGVQVLKGVGEFGPDQVNQIAVQLNALPAEWRNAPAGDFPRDSDEV